MKIAFAAGLVAAASADKINLSISDCGSGVPGHVTGISPSSLTTGQKTTITGSGSVDSDVASASYTMTIKALGVTLQTCTGDMCSSATCTLPLGTGSLDFKGLSCPVKAGPVSIAIDATVAATIPSQLAVLDITLAADGLLCAAIHTSPGFGAGDYQQEWNDFQAVQGARNGEVPEAFKANVDYAKASNAQNSDFQLGWTGPHAAMSQEEFKALNGFKPTTKYGDAPFLGEHVASGEPLADSVDWTTKGAVTPVKDQGQCGSCWAFSTVGATEGQWQLAGNGLVSMSEQQLTSCSHNGNLGCQGGGMEQAFQWYENQNVATEASYPYTSGSSGRAGACKTSFDTAIPKGGIVGYKTVPSESSLMDAVNTAGPIAIAIEADQMAFQMYSSGVLSSGCGSNLDHGVLLVGYGTDGGKDYWKIKNSWGTSFGEAGFIRIKRDVGMCGIGQDNSYPTVSGSGPAPGPGPAPAPTPSGGGHYGKPPCQDDEMQGDVVDGSGATVGSVCAPECSGGSCPTDVPEGTAAQPMCALQDQDTGKQYCALACYLDSGCPDEASCTMIGGIFGVCLYPGQFANGAHFTAIHTATV